MNQPEPQLEIHLPDEDRLFETGLFHYRCRCQYPPALDRKDGKFRLVCGRPKSMHPDWMEHTDPTPWLPSSQQAIQHWKLVNLLSRP